MTITVKQYRVLVVRPPGVENMASMEFFEQGDAFALAAKARVHYLDSAIHIEERVVIDAEPLRWQPFSG